MTRHLAALCPAAATLALGLTPCARGDWSLTTAPDFSQQASITINTWTAGDGLSFTDKAGKLTSVPTREAVLLSSGKTAVIPTTGWRLRLRNGDVVYGEPIGMAGQSVTFRTADLGNVNISLRAAAELTPVDGRSSRVATAGADRDLIKLKGADNKDGETIEGILVGFAPGKVKVAVGADNIESSLELSHIERVSFGGVAAPRTVPTLSARVSLLSGTILTVPLDKPENFSWSIPTITLADPSGGEAHKTIADKLVSVEILGGRVVFLSDIDFTKDEQSTYLGVKYPTQANANVIGGPLRVSGIAYARGLGVHTRSTLSYDLDGSFETLNFRPAIDDAAAPQGEANLSVSLDGKVVWHADNLKPAGAHGGTPDIVSLPVKGAHKLELHAESPGKMDVLGRVDWLNIALIRP